MFKVRKAAAGEVPSADDIEEVEVEFVGGATKRLFGDTAKHFVRRWAYKWADALTLANKLSKYTRPRDLSQSDCCPTTSGTFRSW